MVQAVKSTTQEFLTAAQFMQQIVRLSAKQGLRLKTIIR